MKDDERRLRAAVYADRVVGGTRPVDTIAVALGMSEKRALALAEKWYEKGWWEVGVSVRCGWLTDEGLREFSG